MTEPHAGLVALALLLWQVLTVIGEGYIIANDSKIVSLQSGFLTAGPTCVNFNIIIL